MEDKGLFVLMSQPLDLVGCVKDSASNIKIVKDSSVKAT